MSRLLCARGHPTLARLSALATLIILPLACDSPPATDEFPVPVEVFACHKILIGISAISCTEDIQGPGVLTIAFKPDPTQSSWEVAVRGLAALAEQCEFHGSFDQTRLSALQGRGATELVCPIAASIDRSFHELSFSSLTETPNSSLAISVTLVR